MLIATLTVLYLLFFAGPQGGLVQQIDDAFSAVTGAVTSEERATEVQAALEEAIDFAKTSPFPKPEDALLDVFAP